MVGQRLEAGGDPFRTSLRARQETDECPRHFRHSPVRQQRPLIDRVGLLRPGAGERQPAFRISQALRRQAHPLRLRRR